MHIIFRAWSHCDPIVGIPPWDIDGDAAAYGAVGLPHLKGATIHQNTRHIQNEGRVCYNELEEKREGGGREGGRKKAIELAQLTFVVSVVDYLRCGASGAFPAVSDSVSKGDLQASG